MLGRGKREKHWAGAGNARRRHHKGMGTRSTTKEVSHGILLLAAILWGGVIAGECEFLTILGMAFRTVAKDSLVPGTGPACTQGRTRSRALLRRS
jgi:hypothetical protein